MEEFNPYQTPAAIEPEVQSVQQPAASIGGWLILSLIGLIVGVALTGMSLITTFIPIYTGAGWSTLTDPGNPLYDPLWGPLLIYETIGTVGHLILTLVALIYFVKRSITTPKLMITFLLYGVVFSTIDEILTACMPYFDTPPDPESARALGRSVIYALIWVPYYLRSNRVKATFVRGWPHKHRDGSVNPPRDSVA